MKSCLQLLDCLSRITSERGVLKDEYEYRFVEEAKSAVAAMFLARESELAASSLRGYHKMLSAMFGEETRCDRALQQSRWRVLSFNYDRLFERAFMQRFELGSQQALYGPLRLNSGLNPLSPASVEIDKARFSLLKLHGSAGFAGAEEHGHCNVYGAEPELLKSTPVDDSTCFFGPRQGIYSNRIKPALIVFPHEKNHLKVYPNNTLPYRNYIPTVWAAAADFISQACEIQIIGYSIPRPDWPGLLQLFESAKNCERIIVKDIQPEKVCENLTELLDGFSGKIVPVRTSFE
jgi:hypothetical protein